MRKLLSLLLMAAVLAGAGEVRADVRPPVTVRILGEPRAAEPGVPFKGQLQIETGASLELNDLMFVEDGWDQIALDTGPLLRVDKSRPQVVDFEVVTRDPAQPLVLSFSVDGFPVTRTFDLSPATVAFIRGPNALSKVASSGIVPPLTAAAAVSPGVTVPPGTVLPPTPSAGEKGRSIRIHGRLVYVRSDGDLQGADGMQLTIVDVGYPGTVTLATVATDALGYYDTNIWWAESPLDPHPDFKLSFLTANNRVMTKVANWFTAPYGWEFTLAADFTGTTLDTGWLVPSDISQHPALHIQTTLTRTWRWWMNHSYDPPMVHANWPNGGSGAFYNGQIYISPDEQWREATLSHEYGHHWMEIFALSPEPEYCNDLCDDAPPDDCGHCEWCDETTTVALTEGFPAWMGQTIPESFLADYGLAALAAYDYEQIQNCGEPGHAGELAHPLLAEGFLAAAVLDIGDQVNESGWMMPQGDRLTLGWGPAITCIDLDQPTTVMGFFDAFKARYPQAREGLWATAKYNGFEIDEAVPAAVTGLYSTSHTAGGSSADPTIDLVWNEAVDDASGVQGYGIAIGNIVYTPDAVMDLGDVTSYTTPWLAPGTYYFSIRTLDHAGKWGDAHVWCGPYTIRAPVPANLTHWQFPGWDRVLVPRSLATSTLASVPAPVTLPGNVYGTYWNVSARNTGEAETGSLFSFNLFTDGVQSGLVWSQPIAAATNQYGINLGPVNVRGGRHTLESRVDGSEQVAETNENDNRWAHQWVWSPLDLAINTPITRAAPPLRTAGWEAVTDGSTLYANSDGLRLNADSWWDAAVLRPLAADVDYDLYLHDTTGIATAGFATTVAASGRLAGQIDAVIINRNVVGWDDYDVGVVNYNGKTSNYELVHAESSFLAYGDSTTVPFAANQMLRVWEVNIGAGQVGPMSVTVDVSPANGPVVAGWLNKTFERGSMTNATVAGTSDASGRARLDLNLAEAGYYALVVWRDPAWSKTTVAMNATIEIGATPPDFRPLLASGWHAPIVPRSASDGTNISVPPPSTLPGNAVSTFFNVAVRNDSPSSSPRGLPGQISVDGNSAATVSWGPFPANANGLFNWTQAFLMRGGRHTLAWKLDPNQTIEEIRETNNAYGEQWVWTPLDLANATPVVRAAPPPAYGDWTVVGTGEPLYPNCDGVRMPNAGSYWRGVAVMPGPASDVDLRLHPASTGAKDGFAGKLAGSYWGTGASDFVLVNFNTAPGGFLFYDAGVVGFAGSQDYTVESTATDGWINSPNGVYGPYSLPANRILNLVEVQLPAGQFGVHLMNQTGNVDWGLSLQRADLSYQGKSDVVGMAQDGFGQGQDELFVVDVPMAGWYCVAVWKKNAASLPLAGTYNLLMKPAWATGVDDVVPAVTVTALVEISPNPFNPQTKITFDVAHEGPVQLEIYDLQGRLVRTLVDSPLGIGRHTGTWNGVDNAGSRVASGLYMARLTADGKAEMKKMTLLK